MKKQSLVEASGSGKVESPKPVDINLSEISTDDLTKYLDECFRDTPTDRELSRLASRIIEELRERQLQSITVKLAAVAWRNRCRSAGLQQSTPPEGMLVDWYLDSIAPLA